MKDCIISNLKYKIPSDKIIIYDYKEIEIDDADVPYLYYNQTLYVSLDGNFSEFCIKEIIFNLLLNFILFYSINYV